MYAVLLSDTGRIGKPVFLVCRTHTGNYMHALVDNYLGALRLARPPLRSYAQSHACGPWAWHPNRWLCRWLWRRL